MAEKIVIALVLLALGAGGGWLVNGWRLSGDLAAKDTTIARLQGANTALEAANKQCALNVADVRDAVKGVVDEAQKVNKDAVAAMNRAAGAAARHQKKAEEFLTAKSHDGASMQDFTPADWASLTAGHRVRRASGNLAAQAAGSEGYFEMDVTGLKELEIVGSAAADSAAVTLRWSLT